MMPFEKVMPKFGKGKLHSGSKNGPKVTDKKQALAIMFSEKKKGTHDAGPSDKMKKKMGMK